MAVKGPSCVRIRRCLVYHHQPHLRFSKRERLAVFEWISVHAIDKIRQLEKIDQRRVAASWRLAAETWLRCQGLITVSIIQKVLPHLPTICAYD